MKNKYCLLAFSILHAFIAQANELEGLTLEDFLREAKDDIELNENIRNTIALIDINDDKFFSENEINGFASGSKYLSQMGIDKQAELHDYTLEVFNKNDKNKDNRLQGEEIEEFSQAIMLFMIKQRFEEMDRNHDGVVNLDDTPPLAESVVSFEEASKRINESLKQLETMDSEEMVENWMNNVGQAIAQENYYQMDKDRDNCVTADEYADYHVAQEDKEKDKSMHLTKADYLGIYQHERKADPFCLTKDEYLANYIKSMDLADADASDDANDYEIAVRIFAHMDKDKDGKLTAIEYADYQTERDNEHILGKDAYFDMFYAVHEKNAQKGWITKDEFIESFNED